MNRYKKLENDLREAYQEAKKAQTGDDGGTANLDSTFLRLEGWREAKVLEVIQKVGLYCGEKTKWIGTGYLIDTGGGQGADRTRIRDKFKKILREKGYQVINFDQID